MTSDKWVDFPQPYELLWLKVTYPGNKKCLLVAGWWNGQAFEGYKLRKDMRVIQWMRNI